MITMHNALRIPEVQTAIFSYLASSGQVIGGLRFKTKSMLLAAALTCHAFREAALAVLWHASNNKRVGALLPSSFIGEPLAITDRKFSTLLSYSKLISSIDLEGASCFDIVEALIRRHKTDQSSKLFPRIHTLTLHSLTDSFQTTKIHSLTFDTLITEKLTTLIIHDDLIVHGDFLKHRCGDPAEVLFDIIMRKDVRLHELKLIGEGNKFTSESLSHLVASSSMSQIKVLATGARRLDKRGVRRIAALASLQDLQIANTPTDLCDIIKATRSRGDHAKWFGNLRQLTPSIDSMASISEFLGHIGPTVLTVLNVNCAVETEWKHLGVVLEQLPGSCPLLEELIINDCDQYTRITVDPPTLHPLLSLPHLTKIVVFERCLLSDIDEAFISKAALAWPKLQILRLGRLERSSPAISWRALCALAHNCSSLTDLKLNLDIKPPTPEELSDLGQCVNTSLQTLQVGTLQIEEKDAESYGNFLLQVFPQLPPPFNFGYGHGWQKVRAMAKARASGAVE